jgi:signal transduction histidine kinase
MRYQLFDSLVSVRSDGDGNRPHLGLGLYIVAAIAKAHGGQVAAENRADGRGVVVRVRLPRLR